MKENNNLFKIRREYNKFSLDEPLMHSNPMLEFRNWLKLAIETIKEDATAMVLSTVSSSGKPSSRVVLLKVADERGLSFFSSYESRKAKELDENSYASLLFYWKEMDRQVRVEGKVKKTSRQISNLYFDRRPHNSKLTTIISRQSTEIGSRMELDEAFNAMKLLMEDKEVKRPKYWGGYLLVPERVEFWQGRPNRLHDRIIYEKQKDKWIKTRLSP